MLGRIDELVTFLSGDVALDDLAARLGPIERQAHGKAEFRGVEAWLKGASMNRYPEGYAVQGKPYLVELSLAETVALQELRTKLGDFTRAATPRGLPKQVVFYPGDRGGPFTIVVIANVDGDGELAAAGTTHITLRRDPRSE